MSAKVGINPDKLYFFNRYAQAFIAEFFPTSLPNVTQTSRIKDIGVKQYR